MTWRRAYCSAKRRDGEPCGNPSSDGRGGWCAVHRRAAELAARKRREAERRQLAEHTETRLGPGRDAAQRERRNLRTAAVNAAQARLIAAHRDEYDRYLAEEKRARGIGTIRGRESL